MADAHRGLKGGRAPLAALLAAALGGCASTHPPAAARPPMPPAAAAPSSAADTNWHALILVPFGTRLKDLPFAVGEVLAFHTAAETGTAGEAECYGLQGRAPPRLFGRPVEQYSLCFMSDRLSRVEASVSLPPEEAAVRFAAACAQWRPGAAPAAADRCEAAEAGVEVEARLAASAVSGAPVVAVVLRGSAAARE